MSRFAARTRSDWVHTFLALLPEGPIWPRHSSSVLYSVVWALMGVVKRWGQDVAKFLLIEAFPPTSTPELLLTDWERVLGLPEPCFPAAQTLDERRLQVKEKLRRRPGGQSRAYFTDIARRLGYHVDLPSPFALPQPMPVTVGRLPRITITEYRPFMFGVSRFGDPSWQFAPHRMRFLWTIRLSGARTTWFRFGAGRLGQDPHLTIARAEDLECILQKLKPAHTKLIFNYEGA